jgi:hypothetical protein
VTSRSRIRSTASGEEGIALVIAVLILAVVSVAASAAILYTSTSQQDAYSKKAGQTAYSLAQAGLSNAMAQLTTHYYDAGGQPTNNTTPGDPSWAPTGSQQSTSSTTACTSSSTCAAWSATLDTTGPFTGTQKAAWHITATGTVPNPSSSGVLTRTVKVDVPVNQPPEKVPPPALLNSIYSGQAPSGGCDMTSSQGVVFTSPVYVKGNFCVVQQSGVESPSTLSVGGWLDTSQGGHVGTSAGPISSLGVSRACNGAHASTPVCSLPYDAVNHYYYDNTRLLYTSAPVSNSPSFPTLPTVDWSARQNDSAGWSCTGGKALDAATFDLGGGAYTCTTPSGTLAWDGTTLTINGDVYIAGNLTTSANASFVYTGLGSMFVAGSVSFANNTSLCVGSTSHHACPGGPSWDTTQNMLLIIANGAISGSNFSMEAGIYSATSITFGSGQTALYGPMVTPGTINMGQQSASGFPTLTWVWTGTLGSPDPHYVLGSPTNGQY